MFDILDIHYTGPNALSCTLSMNKLVSKQIFKMSGVPTPRGTCLLYTSCKLFFSDSCSRAARKHLIIVNTEDRRATATHHGI